ncbi:MAG: tRNA adenosine(34) deaminase TadA [Pseudomonadota bacterium]
MQEDEIYMREALQLAQQAQSMDEVPVGAIVVLGDTIIGRGFNQSISLSDPSAHAEMIAIREAGMVLENYRMPEATLYVTLEPCAMCAGLLVHARIKRLVYGASDPKAGACGSIMDLSSHENLNHAFSITRGVLQDSCGAILSQFFADKRRQKKAKNRLS